MPYCSERTNSPYNLLICFSVDVLCAVDTPDCAIGPLFTFGVDANRNMYIAGGQVRNILQHSNIVASN